MVTSGCRVFTTAIMAAAAFLCLPQHQPPWDSSPVHPTLMMPLVQPDCHCWWQQGSEQTNLSNASTFFLAPGIQQNVQALQHALRHPLVYRDSRPRLDSLQKPYVPRRKVRRLDPEGRNIVCICTARTAPNQNSGSKYGDKSRSELGKGLELKPWAQMPQPGLGQNLDSRLFSLHQWSNP